MSFCGYENEVSTTYIWLGEIKKFRLCHLTVSAANHVNFTVLKYVLLATQLCVEYCIIKKLTTIEDIVVSCLS